jgi:hypothetical protein
MEEDNVKRTIEESLSGKGTSFPLPLLHRLK